MIMWLHNIVNCVYFYIITVGLAFANYVSIVLCKIVSGLILMSLVYTRY